MSSTMLGEKAWYMRRWLDRILPNITIEPPHDPNGRAVEAERPLEAPS